MKKTNRKRLELQREVVALLTAIPAANLKYVQGGTIEDGTAEEDTTYVTGSCRPCSDPCSRSCMADGCPSNALC